VNEATPIEDHLLAKYIAGEADATERAEVDAWVALSAANAQEFERMRWVWDLGADGAEVAEVDVDSSWAKLQSRIAAAEGRGRVVQFAPVRRWLAAAAVLTGLFFAARWWLSPSQERFVADASFVSATLSDSSSVVLSPGSKLSARMGNQREVALNGEAYFEVQRDEAHPFVINTSDVEVTVLGTAFTVTAFDTAKSVLVRVREGRVQVVGRGDTLVLTAGQRARFDKQRNVLEPEVAPPAEVWGERIIQFEEAPLPDVVQQLEKLFHVRITLGNAALANCKLTASFEDEPIERILEVIAETYGLTITQQAPGAYVLMGDGC